MTIETDKKREQDDRDFNIEIAGLDIGRIKRFLSPDAQQYIEEQKTGKSRNKLSLLDILLLTDPVYTQLYMQLADRIEEIETVIQRNLDTLYKKLEQSENRMLMVQTNAHQMADGTRVYLDDGGSVYREDGVQLSEDEASSIVWQDHNSTWQSYKTAKSEIEKTKQQIQEIETYRDDVVEDTKNRMHDHKNPMDHDELREALKRLEHEMPQHVQETSRHASTVNASFLSSTFREKHDGNTPSDMPNQSDEAAITDIPDFGNSDDTQTIIHKPL